MEQDVIGNKRLFIEIGTEEVRGALFSSFLGRTRLERIDSVPINDSETAELSVNKLISAFPSDAAITIILPGHLFMIRTVMLPFSDRKRIKKALPYEMDGLLPFPVEELLIDSILSTPTEVGSRVMAIAIPAKLLQNYLVLFPEGRKPSTAIPDFVSLLSIGINIKGQEEIYGVVELEEKKTSMVFIKHGRPVIARSVTSINGSPSSQEVIGNTIKGLLDEGQKISRLYVTGSKAAIDLPPIEGIGQIVPLPPMIKGIPMQEKPSFVTLMGGVIAANEYPWFNILGSSSEAERFDKNLKRFSVGSIILVILGTGDLYMHSRIESQRNSSLKTESRKVFQSVMPEVKKVVREDTQMKDALNKEQETLEALTGKPAPSYLGAVKDIESIIAANPGIKISAASFEGYKITIEGDETGLDAEGIKKIFSDLDGAKETRVEEITQGVEPNRYRFKVRIDLGAVKE